MFKRIFSAILSAGLAYASQQYDFSITPAKVIEAFTPPAGSDTHAEVQAETPAAPDAEQEAGQVEGVSLEDSFDSRQVSSNMSLESSSELDSLRARVAEQDQIIASLEAQVAMLSEPKFTQPQKPAAVRMVPVSYGNYSSCGPGGCGRLGFFRRRR
jgi:hypothetical protein